MNKHSLTQWPSEIFRWPLFYSFLDKRWAKSESKSSYMLYRFVPAAPVSRRAAWTATAAAALLFKAAGYAFARYNATLAAGYAAVYGRFAAVLLFLLWINLLWTMLLSGAVLAASLDATREEAV